MTATLTMLVHAFSKVGKTTLVDTMPAPRLIIDTEGGSRHLEKPQVIWTPQASDPPAYDGSWETCVVYCTDFPTLDLTYQWLLSGQHPFVSAAVDSMTRAQKRIIDHFNGTQALREADWGTLLRHGEAYIQKMCDLVLLVDNPITCVVLTAETEFRGERVIPGFQGKLRDRAPYLVDVIGYLYAEQPDDSALKRQLLIGPVPPFEAGCRPASLRRAFGDVVDVPENDLTVSRLMEVIANG